jgi:peptidoglycan hydrolase-like protein with peptidoglycan-binding domain
VLVLGENIRQKERRIAMGLQSELFRGDPKLEAAAVSDQAHITLGATGSHVKKIQQALNKLNGANIKEDGIYGSKTAAAVLAYKQGRNIINRLYQTRADNIVGKMTIAALDRELLGSPDPKVIIGRRGPIPILSFGLFAPPVAPTAANVSAVIRGNPYVRANASDAGLPPSLPPGHAYEVNVDVIPPLSGSDFIDLDVINTSMVNGIAVLTGPKQIQRQTVIAVLGTQQTEPGNAGQLQIQASLHGKVLANSNGFSVCAHPRSVIVDHIFKDVNDQTGIGMVVQETVESDSGSLSHLDQVDMSELLQEWVWDDPPFPGSTRPIRASGYLPVIPPLGQIMGDRHVVPTPSAGPKGKVQIFQVHMFKCKRCGATDKPVPFSGFEILQELSQKGREWHEQATKSPMAWHIKIPDKQTVIEAKGGSGDVSSPIHKIAP